MASLPDNDRQTLWAHILRHLKQFLNQGTYADATKTEYRQLVDDLDVWLDSQGVEANQAIRASIRGKFSTQEKLRVLALVAAKRSGLVKVGG